MERQNFTSGAPWEDIVGYSRAVKIGNVIEIAGTTAVENGKIQHIGNAGMQTEFILNVISNVLEKMDSGLSDVVRTRIYVTNIKDWESVGKAHGKFFKDIKPASTMVEVSGLVDPNMLVEIEVSAVVAG